MPQTYQGRKVYHTLIPRRDKCELRKVHPRGCYQELMSGSILVLPEDQAVNMVIGGAKISPTIPRRICNMFVGEPATYKAPPYNAG